MYDIVNDDCLNHLPTMEKKSVDITVTSPPYDSLRNYEDSLDWGQHIWEPVIEQLYRVTKKGGVVVWIVSDGTEKGSRTGTSFKQALHAKECGFNLHDTMIWQKTSYVPYYPKVKRYDPSFEYMFIFSKGQPKTFNPIKDRPKAKRTKDRGKTKQKFSKGDGTKQYKENTDNGSDFVKRTSIWTQNTVRKKSKGHPAVFPKKLVLDHLETWSEPGDLVLDPFMGSGTTGLVALDSGRDFIGIEKVTEYYESAFSEFADYRQ